MRVRIKTAVGAGLGSVPGDDIVPTTSRCYHVSAETHVSPGIPGRSCTEVSIAAVLEMVRRPTLELGILSPYMTGRSADTP